MDERFESLMEPLVERFLESLDAGQAHRPSVVHLDDEDQRSATIMFDMIEASWGIDVESTSVAEHQVTTSAEQETTVLVDGRLIKKARASRNLKPSDISKVLESSSTPLTTRDLVKLELQQATAISLQQAEALATSLEVEIENIVHSGKGGLVEYVFGTHFSDQVNQWAIENNLDFASTKGAAQAKMLSAKRRSTGTASEAEWDQLLAAVLESMR
jgi:hypothetical protein